MEAKEGQETRCAPNARAQSLSRRAGAAGWF
ncbi:unnamed protein product, partial [marine sediment metagenome]